MLLEDGEKHTHTHTRTRTHTHIHSHTLLGEDLSDLLALSPEEILLRWFNYHLKQAGSSRVVRNFGKDISDSECYTILLNQIAPEDSGVDMSPMQVSPSVFTILYIYLYIYMYILYVHS